jgi:hypothetical protein
MSKQSLPQLEYHTTETLAEEWGCTPSRIEQYIKKGTLRVCVECGYWEIRTERRDADGCPVDIHHIKPIRGELLFLDVRTAREVIQNGQAEDPIFENYECDYMQASSRYDGEDICIKKTDLLIPRSVADDFVRSESIVAAKKNKKDGVREIYECIGKAILLLNKKGIAKPSAEEVWNKIKLCSQQDGFECITDVVEAEDNKPPHISWVNDKGAIHDMKYGRFSNVVSEFHTKKRIISID